MYRIEWDDGSVSLDIATQEAAEKVVQDRHDNTGVRFEWDDATLGTPVIGFWVSEAALSSSARAYALVREEHEQDVRAREKGGDLSYYEPIFAAFIEDAKTADTMPPPPETMPAREDR